MAGGILLAAFAALPALPAAAQPAALVHVDTVIEEPLAQAAPVLGRLIPRQVSIIAARINGPVEEVLVDVGDRVTQQQPLARINPARLAAEVALRNAELSEREAELQAAEAQLELARQAFQRLSGLQGSAAFSQARYDEAAQTVARDSSLVAVAEAALEAARATLQQAEIDVFNTTIRAPIPGVVSERHADVGEYLSTGAPIVTIVDDTALEVEAAVPTTRVAGLTPGVRVEITLDDGTRHEAVVRALVPLEDSLTRTRTVRFVPEFGETAKDLAGNQSVTVMVPIGEPRTVVTVHKDAVLPSPSGRLVYVVVDGAAQPRPIQIGESVGNRFEVLDGLEAGEVVVVRGNERLRPGQAVTVQPGG